MARAIVDGVCHDVYTLAEFLGPSDRCRPDRIHVRMSLELLRMTLQPLHLHRRRIPVLTALAVGCLATGLSGGAQSASQQEPAMSPSAKGMGQEEVPVRAQPPATRFFYPTGPDIFVPLPTEPQVYETFLDKIRVSIVANGLSRPFSTAFLPDGRILAAGGGKDEGPYIETVEIWDPATGEWSAAAPMTEPRASHSATLLGDGTVLVVGGRGRLLTAEIYDPETNTWEAVAGLKEGRTDHTASLLPDGRVLVAGGVNSIALAEIYDPATGTWADGPTMLRGRHQHTATNMAYGRVLFVGGQAQDGDERRLSNLPEVFTP